MTKPNEQSPGKPSVAVLACASVLEEMVPFLEPGIVAESVDFKLHLTPEKLKEALQEAIDRLATDFDTIVLGYGLCSMAVVGLVARDCTLVVPRVDDCISIFLGSAEAYRKQIEANPGTYYLTKGWIEVSDTIFEEHRRLAEKYGEERAQRMMRLMLKNYTRLVYIDTGHDDQESCRAYARDSAKEFDLDYEELTGADTLVRKMLFGPWDDGFVVAEPGQEITLANFRPTSEAPPLRQPSLTAQQR